MNVDSTLPVAVIGAGPVGLAAAAHLTERGIPFVVLERSDAVAAPFASVAHVRLFSPAGMNIDAVARRLLEQTGWHAPDDDRLLTAGELRRAYLEPLGALFHAHIRFGASVTSIARRGFDKVKTVGRERAPFVLRVDTGGRDEELEARAVIDATGTWSTPNWLGANGTPAMGEFEHGARIAYGMPDVLGAERARYANAHVVVVGAGHSALGSLIALTELAVSEPGTRVTWAVRGATLTRVFGGGANDGLPARGNLGTRMRELIDAGRLTLRLAFSGEAVVARAGRVDVVGRDAEGNVARIDDVDAIIVATGARPDPTLARELRVRLDPWLESTEALAPLIDPNVHSCGSVPPHGHRELTHPEHDYYTVGAKSYGRAPNFLLATGYEQTRSVVAALAGDLAAADDVRLVLPETGVCSSDRGDGDGDGSGCCSTPASAGEVSASCCGPAVVVSVTNSGCCGPATAADSSPAAPPACCP